MFCCGFNPGDGSAYTGKTGFFNPDGTELVNACAINSITHSGCHGAGISYFQYFLYMTACATIFAFVIGVSSIVSAYLLYQKRTARQAFIHKGKGPYQPILGKNREFSDAVHKVISNVHFDLDSRVQVFEVTIRVLGGLLSAHLLASNKKLDCYLGWYNSELLYLARDLADRLMPAFDTPYGLPFPRVNLKTGVLPYEVQEACFWGMESTKKRLKRFDYTDKALYEIWARRSKLNLVGNTMNLFDDKWVDDMAGIGAGVDSFYEYLFKAYVLFGNDEYLEIYNEAYNGVMSHLVDGEGFIYKNVKMANGKLAAPWLDSLSAFFPGLQVLAGDVASAIRPHYLYASLWKRFNCIPERYNFQSQGLSISAYPLRPEFVESTYMLYQATQNHYYLEVGEQILEDLNKYARVPCGFSGFSNVLDKQSYDTRMESFFLSETLKYLYLLFDTGPNIPPELRLMCEAFVGINKDGVTETIQPIDPVEITYIGESEKEWHNCYGNLVFTQHAGNILIDQLRGALMTVKYDRHEKAYVVTAINHIKLQSGGKVYTSLRALAGTEYSPSNQYLSAILKLKQKNRITSVYALPGAIGPLLYHGLTLTGNLVFLTKMKPISSVNGLESGCLSYTLEQRVLLKHSMVVVRRGDCNFVQKVENAYLAGATGVLVLSETPFISMTRPNMLYGEGMVNRVDTIPIPSFFLDDKESKKFLKAKVDRVFIKIVDKEAVHPTRKLNDQVSYFGSSIKNVVIGQGEAVVKPDSYYATDYRKRNNLSILASFASLVAAAPNPNFSVNAFGNAYAFLDYGSFKGVANADTVTFLNIPFAAPPVGKLRFKAPQPPVPFFGIHDATKYGNICKQTGSFGGPGVFGDEDCLNLNIYAPRDAFGLPVIVYVFGGGFNDGSNQEAVFDGRNIIKENPNAIIVTINYRLNLFGWLGGLEMAQEGSVNAGLLDQAAAFKWVRKHIGAFGGDPTQVTAMGESSGAISVGAHLLALDGNQTLFDRAVLLSGASGMFYNTPASFDPQFVAFANSVNCTVAPLLPCLRKLSADVLIAHKPNIQWNIIADGTYVKDESLVELYAKNKFSKVPLLINGDLNEGTIFTTGIQTEQELFGFEASFLGFFTPANLKTLQQSYPAATNPLGAFGAAADFFGDSIFNCPSSIFAEFYSRANVTVYKSINRHVPKIPTFPNAAQLGVYHSSELPYLFQYSPLIDGTEAAFARQFTDSIINFANGNAPQPNWPAYGNVRVDLETLKPESDGLSQKCQFLVGAILQFFQSQQ
ncbi:ER degradation-enhancing alpha-mannosidase-like protein 1 [Terramyces sp. JEL0728]|nr:ER degradation-enhancing alpha-mannosidase-like protein 1 [Terramyces sp. JEL0728]